MSRLVLAIRNQVDTDKQAAALHIADGLLEFSGLDLGLAGGTAQLHGSGRYDLSQDVVMGNLGCTSRGATTSTPPKSRIMPQTKIETAQKRMVTRKLVVLLSNMEHSVG